MMGMLWAVLYVALTGSHLGYGLPIGSSPKTYPEEQVNPSGATYIQWIADQGIYAAVLSLAVVVTVVSLLFGCTWCYRHKDCKQNSGTDNQLFSTSASQLHDASRRSQPPDSGFSENSNNNISEDNNNGPISLREMQNIANNNAAAYIVSENEERNRAASRESVVEFEPLPAALGALAHPLDRCADWFGANDFPRSRLQYLREIGRGWFGRIVEGEIEGPPNSTVAVKILNQDSSLEDKARFLESARVYRDVSHENLLRYVACCLQQEPWILVFELCSMDLQQYLVVNRAKMASLNEAGVPLRLQCDIVSALAYLHARGFLYGNLWCGNVLVRGKNESARGVLGHYSTAAATHGAAPELTSGLQVTTSSEVWSVGTLLWEVCSWGVSPSHVPATEPALPCPYRAHIYQVMQLCWHPEPEARPTAAQIHSLLDHLYTTHEQLRELPQSDCSDFEERWQRLKPNSIPKIDEHIAMVHAPSTSTASHFTGSETIPDTLSVDLDTAISRSSSIMSDKDHLSVQMKSESLNNLHGSLEDLGRANASDDREKEQEKSDSSVDPWLKDIISGSQDDVSYYRDVSDVIKNLDNILNSEKTSSSESSHQASPSRDNLSLDCKKEYPAQSSLVKSPGITNFQNILDVDYDSTENEQEDDADRETIGTLSHSFERHSDTNSQHTLENLTPITPVKSLCELEAMLEPVISEELKNNDVKVNEQTISETSESQEINMPKEIVQDSVNVAHSKELDLESTIIVNIEQLTVHEHCQTACDNIKGALRADIHKTNLTNSDKKIGDKEEKRKLNETLCSSNNIVKDLPVAIESFIDIPENAIELNNLESAEKSKTNIEAVALCLQDIFYNTEQTLSFIEAEKVYSSHNNDTPQNVVSDIVEAKNVDLLINNQNHLKPDFITVPVNVIKIENSESSNEFSSDDRVIKGIVNNKEVIMNSFIDTAQNNDEEMVFEDKHISGEETSLEALNDNTHLSEHSSSVDMLPDFIENIELPLEEIKTKSITDSLETHSLDTQSTLPIEKPDDIVQNTDQITETYSFYNSCTNTNQLVPAIPNALFNVSLTNESTIYMDLINDTNTDNIKIKNSLHHNEIDVNKTFEDASVNITNDLANQNESTVYMDLPTVINATDKLLQEERLVSSQDNEEPFKNAASSTPKGSENTNEHKKNTDVMDDSSKIKTHETKLEHKFVPDTVSPYDSPSKSHPTDTYDENSSVVLGPFENCTLELFKGIKSSTGYAEFDIPKEEILGFSSNFSEINLETPSPLRDGNFLNEVPDIDVNEDNMILSDINDMSEHKSPEPSSSVPKPSQDYVDSNSECAHPPSTPPNSPGTFLASTSKQKYLVDIDFNQPEVVPNHESDSGVSSLQKEIDLSQIEMTAKLAMAENENNLNIEYSGPLTVEGYRNIEYSDPLTVEGIVTDDGMESYLAGNCCFKDRESGSFDEESMQALRNELELKLPLAQVASIEPSEDVPECSAPQMIFKSSTPLSPIAEETGNQLSAYENDRVWKTSSRTDSSSYLEPCNNSTDEVTDLPTAGVSAPPDHSTYTVLSDRNSPENNTYPVQRDLTTSRDLTMSADSLNKSPAKKLADSKSPVNDKTITLENEKETKCERLSQESPYLLSPTTDTTVPENSENVTGISTLSKTVPTDAKSTKPSETQCLSKATSIDSWCSNDTLYNVEENFDDLAIEPDYPKQFDDDHSNSTDTLTHNDEVDKEVSHCASCIVHDSNSEPCDTFSPDSVTAHRTYTKPKNENDTQIILTDHDSKKNIPTKDLTYSTLASELLTYPSCSTELLSERDDLWIIQQPELVRRSPIGEEIITPPRNNDAFKIAFETAEESPKLTSEPSIKKIDSIEISCLRDSLQESASSIQVIESIKQEIVHSDSPDFHYKNIAHSAQSTPLLGAAQEHGTEIIPLQLPEVSSIAISVDVTNSLPSFNTFTSSTEFRSEGISSIQDTYLAGSEDMKSPTYSEFKVSVMRRPQDIHNKSSESTPDITSSVDFHDFEYSVRKRPQDITFLQHASSSLLQSERYSEYALSSSSNLKALQTNVVSLDTLNEKSVEPEIAEPYLNEHNVPENFRLTNLIVPQVGLVDDEQPHSIIVTESPKNASKDSMNATYDSHIETHKQVTFNSHTYKDDYFSDKSPDKNEKPDSSKNASKDSLNSTYDSDKETHNQVTFNSYTYKDYYFSDESPDKKENSDSSKLNGLQEEQIQSKSTEEQPKSIIEVASHVNGYNDYAEHVISSVNTNSSVQHDLINGSLIKKEDDISVDAECNGEAENFATVSFINESFEEISDSSGNSKRNSKGKPLENRRDSINSTSNGDVDNENRLQSQSAETELKLLQHNGVLETSPTNENEEQKKITEFFLEHEKNFCQFDSYLPMLSDIRFTGPASEIMSTSFNEGSPPQTPEEQSENNDKPNTAVSDILKEWDSDSDESHSSNPSSGEFIWKDGDGHETSVVPSDYFDHQRGVNSAPRESSQPASGSESGSGSGSGSEGEEAQFVPSCWDCRAEPAKSALRSLDQQPESKKRVVFKRQKYHCVYEYPREVADVECDALAETAHLPDYSTYAGWAAAAAEEAELSYGLLYGGHPFDMSFPLRSGGVGFGSDYDEDFFISSSSHPFERLGMMSQPLGSQFFPGHKGGLVDPDEVLEEFPEPPSPPPPGSGLPPAEHTPDSGVEDVTPPSTTTDDDFKGKLTQSWRMDSASSSESVSPSSPGAAGEALGGLRHTRDKLKLDLPPSPHLPSPRHNRVFNFVLDKPKPRTRYVPDEPPPELGTTPLVMTDETPIISSTLPLPGTEDIDVPTPTFSTFGKLTESNEPDQTAMILTDEADVKPEKSDEDKESGERVEAVKGEGTVLDSGDEDSGIESSAKATLDRNKQTPNVS